MTQLTCPSCLARLNVLEQDEETVVRTCPRCLTAITVPGRGDPGQPSQALYPRPPRGYVPPVDREVRGDNRVVINVLAVIGGMGLFWLLCVGLAALGPNDLGELVPFLAGLGVLTLFSVVIILLRTGRVETLTPGRVAVGVLAQIGVLTVLVLVGVVALFVACSGGC